jgi:hypothetical protein
VKEFGDELSSASECINGSPKPGNVYASVRKFSHTHRRSALGFLTYPRINDHGYPEPNLSGLVRRIDAAIAEGREAESLAELNIPVGREDQLDAARNDLIGGC